MERTGLDTYQVTLNVALSPSLATSRRSIDGIRDGFFDTSERADNGADVRTHAICYLASALRWLVYHGPRPIDCAGVDTSRVQS